MDAFERDEEVERDEIETPPPLRVRSSAPRGQAVPARSGGLGIVLFVLFVISLLAFGRAPFSSISESGGSRVNFDLLSVAGIAGAVLGLVFIAKLVREGLRPWSLKHTLGVIGAVGLLAHATFAFVAPRPPTQRMLQPAGSSGRASFERKGPETWEIEGRTYPISSTYFLLMSGDLQYTIELPYQFGEDIALMDEEAALAVAFPLMKHALTEGLYDRSTLTKIGSGRVPTTRIGVALVERVSPAVRGFRVALSLDEIRQRLAAKGE